MEATPEKPAQSSPTGTNKFYQINFSTPQGKENTPPAANGSEDSKFAVDEISHIIKEAIEDCIGGNSYNSAKVSQYVSQVVETIMANLIKLDKPFKYIVNGTVMQKSGAGLHTSSSCLWDDNSDGSCTVRWENKTMYCIVSVYALAL